MSSTADDNTGLQRQPQQQRLGDTPQRRDTNLSQEQLHELLNALMRTPPDIVRQVGYLLMLFVAVVRTNLRAGKGGGKLGGDGGATVVSRTPLRTSGATAAEDTAIIASAKKKTRQANSRAGRKVKGGKGQVTGVGGNDHAIDTKALKGWAVQRNQSVCSALKLLRSATPLIRQEDADLLHLYARAIPMEKAARVSRKFSEPRACVGRRCGGSRLVGPHMVRCLVYVYCSYQWSSKRARASLDLDSATIHQSGILCSVARILRGIHLFASAKYLFIVAPFFVRLHPPPLRATVFLATGPPCRGGRSLADDIRSGERLPEECTKHHLFRPHDSPRGRTHHRSTYHPATDCCALHGGAHHGGMHDRSIHGCSTYPRGTGYRYALRGGIRCGGTHDCRTDGLGTLHGGAHNGTTYDGRTDRRTMYRTVRMVFLFAVYFLQSAVHT